MRNYTSDCNKNCKKNLLLYSLLTKIKKLSRDDKNEIEKDQLLILPKVALHIMNIEYVCIMHLIL